jgi:hypothetical protein
MPLPSRRFLLIALGLLAALALLLGLPWLSPTRGVERAWKNVISAIEENDRETLAAHLADNYQDGFGLDRAEALHLIATIRGQFLVCTIRRDQPELVMDPSKHSALTRALIRVDGQGTPLATAAIQASQATRTPTEFRWRRASWRPWDWHLVSVDNADAAQGITRFQRQADQLGL